MNWLIIIIIIIWFSAYPAENQNFNQKVNLYLYNQCSFVRSVAGLPYHAAFGQSTLILELDSFPSFIVHSVDL